MGSSNFDLTVSITLPDRMNVIIMGNVPQVDARDLHALKRTAANDLFQKGTVGIMSVCLS